MFSTAQIEMKLKTLKPLLAERFHVSRLAYFGSYGNGQATESSDLDLLVEFSKPIGWKFFALEEYLEQEFKLKIDLVTPNAIKAGFKPSITANAHYV